VLNFMHVRESPHLIWISIAAGLVWLCILFGLTLSDYDTRGFSPAADPRPTPTRSVSEESPH
jgi:hypothetical protein